ncbi:hypothetical protein, partial [Helicobacter pylori]|uniref:hypothetical protein n=1 Tax=Helicobacter pylori TaxID=210 RepID=UPI0027120EAE
MPRTCEFSLLHYLRREVFSPQARKDRSPLSVTLSLPGSETNVAPRTSNSLIREGFALHSFPPSMHKRSHGEQHQKRIAARNEGR